MKIFGLLIGGRKDFVFPEHLQCLSRFRVAEQHDLMDDVFVHDLENVCVIFMQMSV